VACVILLEGSTPVLGQGGHDGLLPPGRRAPAGVDDALVRPRSCELLATLRLCLTYASERVRLLIRASPTSNEREGFV